MALFSRWHRAAALRVGREQTILFSKAKLHGFQAAHLAGLSVSGDCTSPRIVSICGGGSARFAFPLSLHHGDPSYRAGLAFHFVCCHLPVLLASHLPSWVLALSLSHEPWNAAIHLFLFWFFFEGKVSSGTSIWLSWSPPNSDFFSHMKNIKYS
jgi:hypothetical protein